MKPELKRKLHACRVALGVSLIGTAVLAHFVLGPILGFFFTAVIALPLAWWLSSMDAPPSPPPKRNRFKQCPYCGLELDRDLAAARLLLDAENLSEKPNS